MKKQILKACTIAALSLTISNVSYGQGFDPIGGGPTYDIETDVNTDDVIIHNNLMLGTTTPSQKLTVNGDIGFHDRNSTTANADGYRSIKGNASHDGLVLYGDDGFANGSGIILDANNSGNSGTIGFVSGGGPNFDIGFNFMQYNYNSSTQTGDYNSSMVINKSGFVGIGTESPTAKLTVDGNIGFHNRNSTSSDGYRFIRGNANYDGLVLFADNEFSNGSGIILDADNAGNSGTIGFVSGGGTAGGGHNTDVAFSFMQYNYNSSTQDGDYNSNMSITKDGQVKIGDVQIVSKDEYKLYVQTGILTEKVKVAVNGTADWSDYVFADNYDLKPIEEVAQYIKENKHLPDVPSAEEVVKDGIDLGKMDATLLQKIEELTLYMIDLKNENATLSNEVDELKSLLNK